MCEPPGAPQRLGLKKLCSLSPPEAPKLIENYQRLPRGSRAHTPPPDPGSACSWSVLFCAAWAVGCCGSSVQCHECERPLQSQGAPAGICVACDLGKTLSAEPLKPARLLHTLPFMLLAHPTGRPVMSPAVPRAPGNGQQTQQVQGFLSGSSWPSSTGYLQAASRACHVTTFGHGGPVRFCCPVVSVITAMALPVVRFLECPALILKGTCAHKGGLEC